MTTFLIVRSLKAQSSIIDCMGCSHTKHSSMNVGQTGHQLHNRPPSKAIKFSQSTRFAMVEGGPLVSRTKGDSSNYERHSK